MPKETRTQEELKRKVLQPWEKRRIKQNEQEAQKKIELADGLLERLVPEAPSAADYVLKITQEYPGIKEFIGDYLVRIDKHSKETASHVVGVNILNARFAETAMRNKSIDAEQAAALIIGGILHDSGKLKIPKSILDSPTKLKSSRMGTMRSHVLHSAVMADMYLPKKLKEDHKEFYAIISLLIAEHHVLPNGTGYPKKEPTQPDILQKIFHIADSFEAMTGKRRYHDPMNTDMAIKDLHVKADVFRDRKGEMQQPEYDKQLVTMFEPIMRAFAKEFTDGHKVSSSEWRHTVRNGVPANLGISGR